MTVESTNLPASVGARLLLEYLSSPASEVRTVLLSPPTGFYTQVAVDPRNYRVFVASTSNDTLWVLDVVDEAGSDGGCAVLELQVKFAESLMNMAGSSESHGIHTNAATAIIVLRQIHFRN